MPLLAGCLPKIYGLQVSWFIDKPYTYVPISYTRATLIYYFTIYPPDSRASRKLSCGYTANKSSASARSGPNSRQPSTLSESEKSMEAWYSGWLDFHCAWSNYKRRSLTFAMFLSQFMIIKVLISCFKVPVIRIWRIYGEFSGFFFPLRRLAAACLQQHRGRPRQLERWWAERSRWSRVHRGAVERSGVLERGWRPADDGGACSPRHHQPPEHARRQEVPG